MKKIESLRNVVQEFWNSFDFEELYKCCHSAAPRGECYYVMPYNEKIFMWGAKEGLSVTKFYNEFGEKVLILNGK